MQFVPMTDAELADRQGRFRQSAANNAIEGIILDAEDLAVFSMLDEERVPEGLRVELLHEYLRLRHALPG